MASYTSQNSTSQRGVAMVLALVSALVLSPLYLSRKNDARTRYDTRLMSSTTTTGFVLPVILAGLIIAIKSTSSSSSSSQQRAAAGTGTGSNNNIGATNDSFFPSPDPSWVLRIGSSSWGLAGILVMLMLVLSWQDSVQEFFWR